MDPKATVQALMYAIQRGEFEKARTYLTSDFQLKGYFAKPINAETWLGISSSLKKAFPNIEYHFRVESIQKGNVVVILTDIKGTQQEELDMSSLNMGISPATNKYMEVGHEHSRLTLRGDKIALWIVEPSKTTGLMMFLKQLGINPPVE